MSDTLDQFTPYVRAWFESSMGVPTPPQREGWPAIQRGEHTLILAPTGSGKTLSAFLWGINEIYRELVDGQHHAKPGVRLLYISPLKALNNDVERNLRVPLEGIRSTAVRLGYNLPQMSVAVRTGDTSTAARNSMVHHPPHILITTPESLYLILTSPKARDILRTVQCVIVDEIHTLCGNKRGVHLAVSLERLAHLVGSAHQIQRIGLSATQKPLEEVARFLGGQEFREQKSVNRPVTIVNTGYKKPLDLEVVTVVKDFQDLPADAIWPSIIPQVLQDILKHQSTLVFTNNRRLAERTADRLNAQIEAERSEEVEPGSTEVLAPGGHSRDKGIFAIGASGPIRAHHGSMSKESRHEMETDLKAGKLPALVGTSSLELGIDIGAVDLVVQLQSPKSVSQGLQRVGRSGHLVGQRSTGRIYTTFREDLTEAAAIARGMLDGDVEPTYTPRNPLDILAQQIVAAVSVENWKVTDLFNMVRQAYPYEDLNESSYRLVLDMLSGKYDAPAMTPHVDDEFANAQLARPPSLRARISWDRINDQLAALPGSRYLAISNAGTIPDTGAYGVYLTDGQTKVGDLDEEFIFETRVGDVFLLGSHVWRVTDITNDRITVGDATGAVPRMPFWNGDLPYRPYSLGERIGKFRREIAEKIQAIQHASLDGQPVGAGEWADLATWLRREYALDENSASNLIAYVRSQLDAVGVMSSDTTIVVESFQDAVGEPRLVIHSPFGGRINGAWALALSDAFRERYGVDINTETNDDGILFQMPRVIRDSPLDLITQMTPAEARERILHQLPASEMFGAHFRMNAGRALLLPKVRGAKRTPFWLQRLKARGLLAVVKQFSDFPIVVETYRDCLRDVLDMPHLEELLGRIQSGEVRVTPIETIVPSPVAAGLLFNFVNVQMYEWDAPKAERQLQALSLRRDLIEDVLKGVELRDLLKPEAIAEVVARLQHTADGYRSRTQEELALMMQELGDLSTDEAMQRSVDPQQAIIWLEQLRAQGRIVEVDVRLATMRGTVKRWMMVDHSGELNGVNALAGVNGYALLVRFLRTRGPVTKTELLARYPFDLPWLDETLLRLVTAREVVKGRFSIGEEQDEFVDRHNLEQIHHRTLSMLRKEIQPVSLYAYVNFMAHWQHVHPSARLQGRDGLRQVINQLRGLALPGQVWECDVLPARLLDYNPADLDALCQGGDAVWVGKGKDAHRGKIRFIMRGEGRLFLDELTVSPSDDGTAINHAGQKVLEILKSEGASFHADLQVGTGCRPEILNVALVELVMAGLVTNDSVDVLRSVISFKQEDGILGPEHARKPASSMQAELAERLGKTAISTAPGGRTQRPSRTEMREARKRVTERLRGGSELTESGQTTLISTGRGRWSLVHRTAVLGQTISEEDRVTRLARVLLDRYGIVTKECLACEDSPVDWVSLYQVLQLMEMRGEVRRGYFVNGLPGVQFALPEAVEKLRMTSVNLDDSMQIISATDPVNLFGGELPDGPVGENGQAMDFARLPSTHVVLWQGKPLLVTEDNGERVTVLRNSDVAIVQRAISGYVNRLGAPRHITISQWNGKPILGSAVQAWLQPLGFSRTPSGMEYWANY